MIPDYQTIMLPLLTYLKDGQPHHVTETIPAMANNFQLAIDEINQSLPNSKKKVFNNRIHWARAYLKMAGLIDSPAKWHIQITERGKLFLTKNPEKITVRILKNQFEDFKEKMDSYRKKSKETINGTEITEDTDEEVLVTPEELIQSGYEKIRSTLQIDLLAKLKSVHPAFFEQIVVDLLVKMGYGGSLEEAGKATKYTNDEGIDGIIKEDKLGLDVIYIQAKRWDSVVGRPEVQKFVGALAGQRAKKGVFITTSNFTKEATQYASQMDTKIVLIDGEKLAQYMIDYNLGVSVQNIYEIKKIDSDYFEED